jgi:hypothetical protein
MIGAARSIAGLFVLTVWLFFSGPFARPALSEEVTFAPHQVWSVKSDPPTPTKVIIGRVEPWHDKIVVHVSLVDIPVPEDMQLPIELMSLGHAPFDAEALAGSVDQLLADDATIDPSFDEGYEMWKEANGGVYTLSITQAVDALFQTIRANAVSP